jgi:23S rRNA (uridine2552-2'-O)-methyltransferase
VSRRRTPYARPDARTRAAKAKGYPARSVFKLEEIDRRYRLIGPAQRVLDLGAAPGSWSRYAGERAGVAGRVVAVDLEAIDHVLGKNVTVVQGDALDVDRLRSLGLGPYDVVLSDMAPKTTGTRFTDQVRSFELFMGALDVAEGLGKVGSHFVGKLFMGGDFPEAQRRVRRLYARSKVLKPQGTRAQSYEIYLIGFERRDPTASAP